MKRHFENLTDRATRVINHWWLLPLAGILCVALGVSVFIFPLESYVILSVLLGVLLLVIGAAYLIIASSSGNYLATRGYLVIGGIVDVLLGVFLCVYPAVSLAFLPVMVGICLLYHSFMLISLGGDLSTFRIPGSMWVVCGGILLLLLSLLIVANPFSIGIDTVVIIAGLGLVLLGIMLSAIGVRFKDIHDYVEKEYPR